MTRLPSDFKEFLRLLNAHAVEYLVVGGYAVAAYGYVRYTGDLDVWIAVHPRNAERLFTVLEEFGFGQTAPSPESLTRPGQVLRMGYPPIRIEIQTSVSGVEFDDCWARGVEMEFDAVPTRVISLPDLLRNKRAAGRPKDLLDVAQLEAIEKRKP